MLLKNLALFAILLFFSAVAVALPNGKYKKNGGNPITHQVKSGETLYRISRKYGISIDAIQRANPNITAQSLPVGYELKIPLQTNDGTVISFKPSNNTSARVAVPASPTASATSDKKYLVVRSKTERVGYTIQPGETIQSLCSRYVLTEDRLRELNSHIQDEVTPGQHITLEMRMVNEHVTPNGGFGWDLIWLDNSNGKVLPRDKYRITERRRANMEAEGFTHEEISDYAPPATPGYERINLVHTVAAGETLQKIAKKYNMTVAELTELNRYQLYENIHIGQNLVIGEDEIPLSEEKKAMQGTTPKIGPKENAKDNTATSSIMGDAATGNILIEEKPIAVTTKTTGLTSREIAPKPTKTTDVTPAPSYHNNAVMAVQVDASSKYGTHVAWHHEASIGSYIKITNPLNGKVTFAKVVGKPNDSTAIIEVTKGIATQLETVNNQFEVLLDYND